VFEELRQCDAVIIPSNPHDPRKAVKSPNRFTESVWAGRFVVAHPLPAYEPLAAYGWVGEHLGEGLAWLLDHVEDARERIRAGQEAVARQFSLEAIGRAWRSVIAES
jgi:glycosyltransferase involved in cell wall biosynthesis